MALIKVKERGRETVNLGRRNMLINGDYQVWQRGTSGTVNMYMCDRWYGWGNQQALTQQQADNQTHNSGRFALRVAHNDASANTFSSIAQTLETNDTAKARGKKLTFTIDVKKGSAFTGNLTLQIVERTDSEASINSGTRNVMVTSDITSSLTTSLQRFTCTTTSTVAQGARTIGVNVNHTGTSGTDANNFFQVERAQLEIGDTATDFEHRSYGEELSLCQRYYAELPCFSGPGTGTTDTRGYGAHVVQMRTAPTLGVTGAMNITDGYSYDRTQSSANISLITNTADFSFFNLANFSSMTGGRIHFGPRNQNTNKVTLDSEI